MKIKKLFAILLVITLLTCVCVVPTSAKESTTNTKVEIIIPDQVSDETKAKIERYFSTGEPVDNGTATYGLTCTLFGHKLQSSTVVTVTHKVRSSAPRCVRKTYDYDACTRCDYEISELIDTEYIYCC